MSFQTVQTDLKKSISLCMCASVFVSAKILKHSYVIFIIIIIIIITVVCVVPNDPTPVCLRQ